MRNGAQLLCGGLEAAGVTHAFGLPGTQDLLLHDALGASRIRFVTTTHELGASFMANGYFRASGRLSPIFAIPGPGFMYALTGLAEAMHDSVASLLVVGAPPEGDRKFQFQAMDQAALARPVTKGIVEIRNAEEVHLGTRRAIELALGGEPGPVLLQLGRESMQGEANRVPSEPKAVAVRTGAELEESCRLASLLVGRAVRPLVLAGQGAVESAGPLRHLVEGLGAPVLTTTSGRGVLPEDHPLSLAFELARGNLDTVNELVSSSDCVLVLGCKLTAASTGDFRLQLPSERTIRVDTGSEVLAAGYPSAIRVTGRVEDFIPALVNHLGPGLFRPGTGWMPEELASWRQRLARGSQARLPEVAVRDVAPPSAQALFGALRRALPRDGIVVTDSGLHQELVRRWFDVLAPRGLIVPSDFQSMGFGLPAAIGAALAAPERPVVAVIGDGAFSMTAMELLTAVRIGVPLVVIVMADGFLNRIRLQQFASSGSSHGVELLNPDFAAFAESVGAVHEVIGRDPEVSFRRALRNRGVTLLEVRLGDTMAVHRSRLRGTARGIKRGPMVRSLVRWVAGKTRG